ncbi:hypothetical protein S958_003652 [Salmonella enterica subsp. enterica]|nr:hypothetical protein [Salmonella enterica subsp. enterica]EDW9824338.1 hypothetical protein [Salmonella enterica]EDP8616211.1 hypothetical protein [Salmonella enterica subsp. enterica]EDT2839174.1 hypothetical protein [Salmonella enterica subsp. enterica]EHH2964384.1 hypothetical protein [Salmonella enterica]
MLTQYPQVYSDKPQPGQYSRRKFEGLTCGSITQAAIRDGVTRPDRNDNCPKGYHKIYLVIAPSVDYHWYREDSKGSWSHKPGNAEISDVDASWAPITNSLSADHDYGNGLNYSRDCGGLCAKD